ncbi:hypothetical protein JW756_02065 [Candidatus Woesearchaeota archaeon]|nr:hypothetical protein [Candidatus Woesearchaeota archaeon]
MSKLLESKKEKKQAAAEKIAQDKWLNTELILLAILAIILILSISTVVRLIQSKPVMVAGESYYNLRIAQELKSRPFIGQDPIQSTPYELNPYHYFLALLLMTFPPETVPIFLSLLLGVISALVFFQILLSMGFNHKIATYSLFILAVTPAFIKLFTGLYTLGFVITLSLIIIFLMLSTKKSKFILLLCILLFILLGLTSLTGFLIIMLIIFILCLALQRKLKLLFIPATPAIVLLLALGIFTSYTLRFNGFHAFDFKLILSILNADIGFDIFLMVLFFIGFLVLWTRQEKKRLLHLAVLGFLIISLFNSTARAFVSFILVVYCIYGINYLYNRKWELEIIRAGTLLLVLCSLVFSVTNELSLITHSPPDKEMQNALLYLKGVSTARILTSEDNGFMVEFYAAKSVILDSNTIFSKNYSEAQADLNKLFRSVRLTDAEPLLQKYRAEHILITPDMKETLWENRDQGLWLLLKHSTSFIKKYDSGGIEIWEYIPV